MAKQRKTLKEKKQSQLRQQRHVVSSTQEAKSAASYSSTFTYEESKKTDIHPKVIKNGVRQIDEDSLLIVPSHYIKSDLMKTFFLTVFFLLLIIGLYWYFELGGTSMIRLGR